MLLIHFAPQFCRSLRYSTVLYHARCYCAPAVPAVARAIPSPQHDADVEPMTCSTKQRFNVVGIQMLPESLHKQIFGDKTLMKRIDARVKMEIQKHLRRHDLADKVMPAVEDVEMPLPPLYGKNIDEHFQMLANKQISESFAYASLSSQIVLKTGSVLDCRLVYDIGQVVLYIN